MAYGEIGDSHCGRQGLAEACETRSVGFSISIFHASLSADNTCPYMCIKSLELEMAVMTLRSVVENCSISQEREGRATSESGCFLEHHDA